MKLVFVDSSVLFTAANSPTGGSAKLFTFRNIKLAVSPLVLTETERNVRKKLHSYQLERFFKLVEKTQILDQKPDINLIEKAKKLYPLKTQLFLLKQSKQNAIF